MFAAPDTPGVSLAQKKNKLGASFPPACFQLESDNLFPRPRVS